MLATCLPSTNAYGRHELSALEKNNTGLRLTSSSDLRVVEIQLTA
jgi:hypothetical protein